MPAPPPYGPSDPHQGQPPPGPPPQGPPPGYQGQPQQPGPPPGQVPPPGFGGPQGPPPGGQTGPYSGGGNRKRNLLLAGGAAGAVLLVTMVGIVVYLVADSRPYASMPDCADSFPEEVFEDLADGAAVDVDGEYDTDGDYDQLSCFVMFDEGESGAVSVEVQLHEAESDSFEENHDLLTEELETMEDQLSPGELGEYVSSDDFDHEEYAWDAGSPGDIGFSAVGLGSEAGTEVDHAVSAWMENNLSVSVSFTYSSGDMDWEDGLESVRGLSGDVSSQISSVAERE